MARNADFHSTTKKVEHNIPGTDLYYFPEYCGVNEDGHTALIETLEEKMNATYGEPKADVSDSIAMLEDMRNDPLRNEEVFEAIKRHILENKADKSHYYNIRKYALSIYRKPDGVTFEELVEMVEKNAIPMVSKLMFSTSNKMKLDDNGNLLLQSVESKLENAPQGVGDFLLDREGNILRNTKGSMTIYPCDEFGNYPVVVYDRKRDSKTGRIYSNPHKYNYLDKDGHLYTQKHFERSETPVLYEIKHTYQDDTFIDRNFMYPKAYVITDRDGAKLYPSATALLIAHRSALLENAEAGIVGDEKDLLVEHYKRFDAINDARKKLQAKFNNGSISESQYVKAMRTLDEELGFMRIFTEDFETKADLKIQEELDIDYFVSEV